MKVLLSCKEDLQKLEEQSEEVTEEAVSQEHRYPTTCSPCCGWKCVCVCVREREMQLAHMK